MAAMLQRHGGKKEGVEGNGSRRKFSKDGRIDDENSTKEISK